MGYSNRYLALFALVLACGAPQHSAPSAALDASQWLDRTQKEAHDRHAAVVVVAGADWCEPCNELHQRYFDATAGQKLRENQVVRELDVETPLGQAVAARLGVLGYPTTLVLRPQPQLVEVGRIEGWDTLPYFTSSLNELLQRPAPLPAVCAPGDATPITGDVATALPAVRCAVEALHGPAGASAARRLSEMLRNDGVLHATATWPAPQREELLGAFRQLGRWQTRVANQHDACAQTFTRAQQWPGTPAEQVPTLLYWQAKCTLRDARGDEAKQLVEQWLAASGDTYEARALAADFVVHEALAQPWGPQWGRALLQRLLAERPGEPWNHYLLGLLLAEHGPRAEARAELERAVALKPESALFVRQLARVRATGVP
jgi:thiol-disulfide isomerase/thioredoxin